MRSRTSTRLARVAALPLAASLLVACGGGGDSSDGGSSSGGGDAAADDSSSYCESLDSAKESFDSLESSDPQPGQIEEVFSTFQSLAEEAPSEVSADWKVISDGFGQIESALSDIGMDISEFDTFRTSGKLPEGVTQEQLQQAVAKIGSLNDEKFSQAFDDIAAHAKQECDIDLNPNA